MTEVTTPAYPPAAPAAPAVVPVEHVAAVLDAATKQINQAAASPQVSQAVASVKPTISKYAKVRGVLYEAQKVLGVAVATAPTILFLLPGGSPKDLAVSAVGLITAAYGFLSKANLSSK